MTDPQRKQFLTAVLCVASTEFDRIAENMIAKGLSPIHLGLVCAALAELGEEASRFVVVKEHPGRIADYETDLIDIRAFTKEHTTETTRATWQKTEPTA